jgi:hypothetical protein
MPCVLSTSVIDSKQTVQETAKYPEIVAEIEEEINNHEWFK